MTQAEIDGLVGAIKDYVAKEFDKRLVAEQVQREAVEQRLARLEAIIDGFAAKGISK